MVIEHVLLAEQLVEGADEKDRVRRIAGVDHVEAATEEDLQRQPEFHGERDAVLERVTQHAVRFRGQAVAMDVDVIDALEALFVAGRLRADDRDDVAGRRKRARLLPHAPVERTRQVLDDDEHAAALADLLDGARIALQCGAA